MKKSAIVVAAGAVLAGLAGCKSRHMEQNELADLKSQVSRLQSDMQTTKASADAAASAAQSANQTASEANSTAQQALASAQTNNEKIDRAMRQAASK
jgi:biopolymer transport protein ExbB/TolQ